ncbi:16S rRNA (guanine(527)-N(7))-methyltransferase RsmG [Tateyamaria sp.]|uniref:16S rRNA (guanine(527)-N(7))-methyltransferase RsmG n=1 Tax=Tateyamaria sp. TaxID=1929288 RepID=UPI003B2159B1
MMHPPDWFAHDVSRETLDKLSAYHDLLIKWTGKINLIAKSTIDDAAHRHIWDSAQVYQPVAGKWADLGSGGGLPGVVVAILAAGQGDAINMTLVESDQRKATFLRTCARTLDVPMTVIAQRIEQAEPQGADVISARALATLSDLLGHSQRHIAPSGTAVFMKGGKWASEMEEARKNWRFSYDVTASKTNPDAAILRIRDIERA